MHDDLSSPGNIQKRSRHFVPRGRSRVMSASRTSRVAPALLPNFAVVPPKDRDRAEVLYRFPLTAKWTSRSRQIGFQPRRPSNRESPPPARTFRSSSAQNDIRKPAANQLWPRGPQPRPPLAFGSCTSRAPKEELQKEIGRFKQQAAKARHWSSLHLGKRGLAFVPTSSLGADRRDGHALPSSAFLRRRRP
jgi:hypothetical protein